MMTRQDILQAFNFRHACKAFDPRRRIPDEDFNLIPEKARLSPVRKDAATPGAGGAVGL